MSTDQPDDVYTRGDEAPRKLQRIDPRRMKLKQITAAEKMVGRRLATEIETGDLGIDTMQAFLAVTIAANEGGNLKAPDYLEQVMDQAGEYELGELAALFEDEDDGSPPPLPPGTPDPTLATLSGGVISDGLPAVGSFEPPPSSNASGV